MPNGIFITDASVTKRAKSFSVSLTPAQCGYGFPLIGITGAADQVNPQRIPISVTRKVSATPPVGGMFGIGLYGKVFQGET